MLEFVSNELLSKRRAFIKIGSEIVINVFYGTQEITFFSNIGGKLKKIARN